MVGIAIECELCGRTTSQYNNDNWCHSCEEYQNKEDKRELTKIHCKCGELIAFDDYIEGINKCKNCKECGENE